MEQSHNGLAVATRQAEIEASLADYPHITDARLEALIAWFRKEASALDVAMLASNEAIAEPYRRFRAEHIDPMTGKDVMKGLLLAALAGLAVFLIIWRAL